jgi:hypothetical protein
MSEYTYERTVTASTMDGPWAQLDEHGLIVWASKEMYGRVHHITGDLNEMEKLFLKIQQHHRDVLQSKAVLDQDVFLSSSEVIVDGLKGGRNNMVMYYMMRAVKGPWSEEQQKVITGAMTMKFIRGFKDFPA